MASRFALKVIWPNGEEEFLKTGPGAGVVASFPNKKRATIMRDFMLEGNGRRSPERQHSALPQEGEHA